MGVQLLNGEIKNHETYIGNEKLILTNKRLIYIDSFIGINELKRINIGKAELNSQKIYINESNLPTRIALITMILIVIIIVIKALLSNDHLNDFGFYFLIIIIGVICSMIIGFPLGHLITFLLKLYIKATSKKKIIVTSVSIAKTDNTYFINGTCKLSQFDELKSFETIINNIIYK